MTSSKDSLQNKEISIGKSLPKRAYLLLLTVLTLISSYFIVSPRVIVLTEIEGEIDKYGKSLPIFTIPSEATMTSVKLVPWYLLFIKSYNSPKLVELSTKENEVSFRIFCPKTHVLKS